jgi:hypothetical protein
LRERPKLKRYYYAGGLMVLLGVGAAVTGSGYKVGSPARMGPGFMPVVLGVVLAFLGILIAGTALGSSEADDCVSPKSLPGKSRSRPISRPRGIRNWRVNWISVDRSTSGLLSLSVPIESERAPCAEKRPLCRSLHRQTLTKQRYAVALQI